MVNLILVSHSHTLAKGVAELAEQMNNGCQIAIAAGMSEPENAIGTDATKIMLAIEEVYTPDGVLILMDLGSAILSAETALELIDPDMAANVKLCAAPLVEGALAAVVSASSGADLSTVAKEAEGALAAKLGQIGGTQAVGSASNIANLPPADALRFSWTVQNPHGLHARPTAKLVELSTSFQSQIWLENQGRWADAKSYNQLIQLQVRCGQRVTFHFVGSDSEQAHYALNDLANIHFGETLKEETTIGKTIYGIPIQESVSEGIALSFHQQLPIATLAEDLLLADKQLEVKRALSQSQQQLAELASLSQLSRGFSELFKAHQMLLEELVEPIIERLPEKSIVESCQEVLNEMKTEYLRLEDPYWQARALDIDDLHQRILCNLFKHPIDVPAVSENCILVADELYPSILAETLARCKFQGICLQQGNPYSHTALLAKSVNLPLIVQCGDALSLPKTQGNKLNVNWSEGTITFI